MPKKQILVVLGLVVALLLIAAGCGWVENLQVFKQNNEAEAGQEQGEDQAGSTVIQRELTAAGEETPEEQEPAELPEPAPAPETAPDAETREIVLYFASVDGNSLEAETRQIPKQEGVARATVNELLSGPQSPDLSPTLPAGAILEDIDIANGVCTVDFSSELLDNISADQSAQLLALYSIVNTLTQFDSVDYVRILIDGRTLGNVGGVNAGGMLSAMDF